MRYQFYFSAVDKSVILDRMLAKSRAGEFHGIWRAGNGVNVRYQLWESPTLITWHKAAEMVGVSPSERKGFQKATLTPIQVIEEKRRKLHEQSERRKEHLRAFGHSRLCAVENTPEVAEPPQRYWSTSDVARLSGASLRQLQWWDETRMVKVAHSGNQRQYFEADVIQIMVIATLRKRGLTMPRIWRAMPRFRHLKREDGMP